MGVYNGRLDVNSTGPTSEGNDVGYRQKDYITSTGFELPLDC
jgi:hypothetical protein